MKICEVYSFLLNCALLEYEKEKEMERVLMGQFFHYKLKGYEIKIVSKFKFLRFQIVSNLST